MHLPTRSIPACLLMLALATPAAAAAQVSTRALPGAADTPTAAAHPGRQTGLATYDRDGRQVIVRSYEPAAVLSEQYRIDFVALDVDGDGHISRAEAAAHATLAAEFNAIDANRDGRLSRSELGGWIR